jgi:Cu+-exporting ATPase
MEKPKAEKQKKNKAEKAVLRKVTAEEIGKEVVCPVTGEKLTVKKDTGSASYKGKTYYFCCPGCDKSFLANPEKFVGKKAAAAPAKVYACPMGDYQGDKPGKCPKCGMNLEEKK